MKNWYSNPRVVWTTISYTSIFCWELTQLAGPIPWTSTSYLAGWPLLHICWGTVETIPTIQASCWDIGASYRTRWPLRNWDHWKLFFCVDKKRGFQVGFRCFFFWFPELNVSYILTWLKVRNMMKYDRRVSFWRLSNGKFWYPWKYCTLKLCHHVPSKYRLCIYIYIDCKGPSGEYLGNKLLGCSYPHFPLETIMKDFIPQVIFLPWCSKKIQPFIPFWGEHVCFFTVNFFVFPVYFFRVCFKNSNPWKPGRDGCDFNHHLLKLFLAEPQVSHLVECKGKSLNLPSFWGKWIVRVFLPWIYHKKKSFFVGWFYCGTGARGTVSSSIFQTFGSKAHAAANYHRCQTNPRDNGQTKGETNRERPLL